MVECRPMPKSRNGASRNILAVQITPRAMEALKVIEADTDWSRKDIVARVMAWIAGQDDEVRKIVLGLCPESLVEQARQIAIARLAPGQAADATRRGPRGMGSRSIAANNRDQEP